MENWILIINLETQSTFHKNYLMKCKISWCSLLLLTILLWLSSCQEELPIDHGLAFQNLLEKNVFPRSLPPGLGVHIEAPRYGISWAGVAGVAKTDTDQKVSINQPYRIASITKTFVATSILLLYEEGHLDLDDPIINYLSEKHIAILQKGNYALDAITIRQCLNHTSGLFDYARSQRFEEVAIGEPNHNWTRTEQLEGAMEWGEATGAPGEFYEYSDTGYILLGEVVERLTQQNLGVAVRQLIDYERLGLQYTWWEKLELTPANTLSQVSRYKGGRDVTSMDPSFDLYGGGGIVSTSTDLALFMQHLFNHRIFKQKATLDLMLSKSDFSSDYTPYKDYRLGVYKVTLYGMEVFMHSGIWGTQLIHIPAYNASIALNHTNWGQYYVLKQIVHLLGRYTAITPSQNNTNE